MDLNKTTTLNLITHLLLSENVRPSKVEPLEEKLYNYIFSTYTLEQVLTHLQYYQTAGQAAVVPLRSSDDDRSADDEVMSLFSGLSVDFSDHRPGCGQSVMTADKSFVIENVNMAQVNQWVQNQTSGFLKNTINPTTNIYASVMDLNGIWNESFDPNQTVSGDFYLPDGGFVQVPFMTSKTKKLISAYPASKHHYSPSKNHPSFKVLSLPYKPRREGDFSMLLVLPDQKEDFSDLRNYIGKNEDLFFNVFFPREQVEVGIFRVPKFKMSFRMDFAISDKLYYNKCFIKVDEKGTRGIGASVGSHKSGTGASEKELVLTPSARVVVEPRGSTCRDEKLDFVADHPFMIFIRENEHGVMWFNGGLINPCAN